MDKLSGYYSEHRSLLDDSERSFSSRQTDTFDKSLSSALKYNDKGGSKPTILMRSRIEKESISPKITSKISSESVSALAPPPAMGKCMKIIDEYFKFADIPTDFLLDQDEFTVVGVLGLQGVGKSTIMSLLSSFIPHNLIRKYGPFKTQGMHRQASSLHCTNGIDLYITSDRLFLLDTQPLLSPSILDRMIQDYKKSMPSIAEFPPIQNMVEIQSIQLISFLLSVCHVVIVVQDYFIDPTIIRLIQSAEMLKLPTPAMSKDNEIIDYFPHVLFLQNLAQPLDFSPSSVKEAQQVYYQAFQRSQLQIQSGLGISASGIFPTLNPEISDCEPVNYFLIPDFSEPKSGHFTGHPGSKVLIEELKRQLLSLPKQALTPGPLTEKKWVQYASKVWDDVLKSSFFVEYGQLLP